MQVSKWGDDLAVRLPATLVEALALKEGDEVQLDVHVERKEDAASQMTREEAIARWDEIRASLPKLPEGYKFRRQDAYER